jgi:cardiolipin synthase
VTLPINIPNLLTVGRILLTPLFVILLIRGLYVPALFVFTLAAVSDGLDGFIARVFNQRTALGAYLDPIADKLLLSSAFVSLAVLELVPAWLTVIVISRDVIIFMGIAVLTLTAKTVTISPSLLSKCTTLVQLITVFAVLIESNIAGLGHMEHILFWTAAGLTILSGLHYIYIGLNILQDNSENMDSEK